MIFSCLATNGDFWVVGKTINLLCTAIYAIYLIDYYKFKDLVKIIYISEIIITIITLVFIVVFPVQGAMYYDGKNVLRGAFIHKNLLGANMVFAILTSFIYISLQSKLFNKSIAIINIIFSILLILGADSMTSIIIVIMALGLGYLYKTNKLNINPTLVMIFFHGVIYYFVFYGEKIQKIFFDIFQRNLTLTGRNDIWINTLNVIMGKSETDYNAIIGYGLSNVWRDNSQVSNYLRYKTFNELTGAHNGFLEWILETGIIATIVLLIVLLIAGYKIIKIGRYNKIIMCFFVEYIIYIMIFYVTEHSTNPLNYQILIIFLIVVGSNKYYRLKNNL